MHNNRSSVERGAMALDSFLQRKSASPATHTINGISVSSSEVLSLEMMPLQREMPQPTPFPIKALGEVLGQVALKCNEVIQAPLAICGNSILAAATLAVQGHANCLIDGRRFPLSEFFVTIGESGERKSEVDKNALWPHRKHQTNLCRQYDLAYADYKRADEAYERTKADALNEKKKGGASSGINKSFAEKKLSLDELSAEQPQKPLGPLLLCEEPTYEGLVKMLAAGQPSVGLFSDEGGRFIGGHGMNVDNLLKTAAGLSGVWDGKPISRVRSSDGAAEYPGRRVSFHLMMQPEISQEMLSNSVLMAQGFLSRCLVTWPQSTTGTRQYRAIDLSQSAEMKCYSARMLEILETPAPVTEGTRNELAPRDLSLDLQAKLVWVAFHDHIESQIGDGGDLAPIKGLANKAPEHAARLAGVLALVENINSSTICLDCMQAGIKLTTHYINEALRLFAAGACDPNIIKAEKLLHWLKGRKDKNGNQDRYVSLVEIYQAGPVKSLRSAKSAREIMRILLEHGQLSPFPDGVDYGGQLRREAYKVNV